MGPFMKCDKCSIEVKRGGVVQENNELLCVTCDAKKHPPKSTADSSNNLIVFLVWGLVALFVMGGGCSGGGSKGGWDEGPTYFGK